MRFAGISIMNIVTRRTPVIIPMVAMLFFVTSDNIMVNMLINAAPAKDNPTKIKAACPTVRLNGRNRTNCSIVSYPSNPYKKAIIPNMSRERSSVKPTPTVNPARVFAAYNFFFPRRVQRITWSVFRVCSTVNTVERQIAINMISIQVINFIISAICRQPSKYP